MFFTIIDLVPANKKVAQPKQANGMEPANARDHSIAIGLCSLIHLDWEHGSAVVSSESVSLEAETITSLDWSLPIASSIEHAKKSLHQWGRAGVIYEWSGPTLDLPVDAGGVDKLNVLLTRLVEAGAFESGNEGAVPVSQYHVDHSENAQELALLQHLQSHGFVRSFLKVIIWVGWGACLWSFRSTELSIKISIPEGLCPPWFLVHTLSDAVVFPKAIDALVGLGKKRELSFSMYLTGWLSQLLGSHS